nr:MAG TPA: hypothetical protein [Caudoviricetes sp.]
MQKQQAAHGGSGPWPRAAGRNGIRRRGCAGRCGRLLGWLGGVDSCPDVGLSGRRLDGFSFFSSFYRVPGGDAGRLADLR